ncbi:putative inactive serine/threonine-protein kinase scy1 [Psilocybe cubensis]|uniref:Inactive serine/threonine-protein kinase scy1 n=2 Tax=Psilocybe cubensis TaxID=181762 RepID=A0ACB8HB66_PSICU|nr:putative inactive serine/threonine-protein kinase scy1 [Psilocybe cubensis]KAH9485238.1 putative inactive serine/threonine-protein kinase scy1 [Psilocybe cubensis]
MDYLRTLGSAAVSTLVQKSGLNLPFSLGTKLTQVEGYYTIYDATKRDDGSLVSVFEYDFSDSKKSSKPFAQNALRKLRTTRHPDVLKFMDAVESDSSIYIMTERIRPLSSVLPQYSNKSAQEKEDWLLWGLHRISVALTFLNDQCISTHGKLCSNSIFLTPSGEWKLGGFELLSNAKDEGALLYTMGGLLPGSAAWASPEVKKSGWSTLKESDPASADAYALGLLLHAVFNPNHPPPPTAEPPHPPPAPASRGAIPASVFPCFKKLLNPNPKGRLSPKAFLEIGMAETGFFFNNRLVKVCSGLDNFALANEAEKTLLLKTLKESASSFPPEFAAYRVLPSLLSALEFGGASAAAILPLVLQFGANTSPEEYPKVILAPIIKLYASPDRGTRMALLEHLPEYIDKLDKKAVSDKIFPHLQLGFSDTVAVIREATVKSIILFAPKLSDRIINNDLLRLLAKSQTDPEPSIRTNTCILLGRLGPSLGYNTKRKVLVPAFSRALKDPFVHARVAGLMAFMASIECFEVPELASKVIPNMSFTLVDDEKLVRDQAFKALEIFVKKLEDHASKMPATAIVSGSTDVHNGTNPTSTTLVNSAAGAAGSLAGWAINSLGKKMAVSELIAPISSVPGKELERSTSAPDASSLSSHIGELTRPSLATTTQSSQTLPNSPSTSKIKAMQLGANKVPGGLSMGTLADDLANEAAAASASVEGNPWGSDDLIDVHADDDDWSAFETAPTQQQVHSPSPAQLSNNNPFSQSSSWGLGSSIPSSGPTDYLESKRTNTLQRAVSPISRPYSSQSSRPISPPHDQSWEESGNWESTNTPSSPSPRIAATAPVALSKEDKALEMARRKEERKQRIAMLKEQKKSAGKT